MPKSTEIGTESEKKFLHYCIHPTSNKDVSSPFVQFNS